MEALSTKAWPWAWTGLNEMVRVSGDDCAGGEGEERNGRRYEDSRRGPGMYMAGAGMGRMKEEEWKNEYMADSLPMNIGGEQIRSRSDTRCEVSRSPTVKPTQHSSSLIIMVGQDPLHVCTKYTSSPWVSSCKIYAVLIFTHNN